MAEDELPVIKYRHFACGEEGEARVLGFDREWHYVMCKGCGTIIPVVKKEIYERKEKE